jgi:O-antigen/teichoic acid export membrane protein
LFKGIVYEKGRILQWIIPKKPLLSEFFSASLWLIAYGVTLAIMSRMSVLMLSHFSTQEELANYGVGFQYYSIGIMMLGSIQAVLRPKFSRIEMQSVHRQREFLIAWLRISFWVSLPLLIFILIGKTPFIYINGIQYKKAFFVLTILSVGIWLSIMLSPLVNILWSRKDFKFLFLVSVFALFINILVNFIGVKMWGSVGAAIAVVITHNFALQLPILWRVGRGVNNASRFS